ncbi:MAG: Holliday junction resolvase RuvX [bacterium]
MPEKPIQRPAAVVVLAFDFGLRHIGVAVGQSLTGSARGAGTLAARQGKPNWRDVDEVIAQYRPHQLLVGHPLNMDNSRNDITEAATRFAARLAAHSGLPTELHDERLTTRMAKSALAEAKAMGQAKTDHELAACLILQSWLNERANPRA